LAVDLNYLRVFNEIALSGSLSAATSRLHISQPAVSRTIANLEEQLGVDLFTRHSRGVTLTQAGRRLFSYTDRALAIVDAAERDLSAIRDLEAGSLTLAATRELGNYYLPSYLADYAGRWPSIDISMITDNLDTVVERVGGGDVELGFMACHSDPPAELYCEPLSQDDMVFSASPDIARECDTMDCGAVSARQPLICPHPGSPSHQYLMAALEPAGVKPLRLISLEGWEAVRRGVTAGMGLAFTPHCVVRDLLDSGRLASIDMGLPLEPATFYCAHRKEARLTPAALGFLSLIRQACRDKSADYLGL